MSTDVEVGWVIVELMGRTKVAGRLSRDEIGLRLDMPATPGQSASTHWYGPAAIYTIHAVDEATARVCAAAWRPKPVSRWELPAATETPIDASPCMHPPGYFDDPWSDSDDERSGTNE